MNIFILLKQLTIDEAHELLKAFHDGCQKAFPIDEHLIDEINMGRFPDGENLKVNEIHV